MWSTTAALGRWRSSGAVNKGTPVCRQVTRSRAMITFRNSRHRAVEYQRRPAFASCRCSVSVGRPGDAAPNKGGKCRPFKLFDMSRLPQKQQGPQAMLRARRPASRRKCETMATNMGDTDHKRQGKTSNHSPDMHSPSHKVQTFKDAIAQAAAVAAMHRPPMLHQNV